MRQTLKKHTITSFKNIVEETINKIPALKNKQRSKIKLIGHRVNTDILSNEYLLPSTVGKL